MTNSQKLQMALNEGKEICQDLNIPFGSIVSITENPRLSATWGRCKETSGKRFEIEIKSRLLADDVDHQILMNTVLHEMIHTCKNCMNHGEVFKRYAKRLNDIGYDVQTYVTEAEHRAVPDEPKPYKYMVVCEDCGNIWFYSRRGAVVRSLQRNIHSCTCQCGSRNFKLENLAQ